MAFAAYFNSTPLRMTLWAHMCNFCMSGLVFLKNGLTFALLCTVQKSFRKEILGVSLVENEPGEGQHLVTQ